MDTGKFWGARGSRRQRAYYHQLNLRKQQESQESQERKLQQLARDLPAAYYGFEGDEDTPEYKSLLEDEDKVFLSRRLQIANNIREDDSSLVTIPDSLLQVPSPERGWSVSGRTHTPETARSVLSLTIITTILLPLCFYRCEMLYINWKKNS